MGTELGVSPDQARLGLAACAPPKMRLQVWEANGIRVIDDTYNANADSVLAALQTLADLPCGGRRIAVLGDMAELGEHTAQAHREVGRRAGELGIHCVISVGKWAQVTAESARAAGAGEVREFADMESSVAAAKLLATPGDLVLLKASRVTGLEKLADALKGAKP